MQCEKAPAPLLLAAAPAAVHRWLNLLRVLGAGVSEELVKGVRPAKRASRSRACGRLLLLLLNTHYLPYCCCCCCCCHHRRQLGGLFCLHRHFPSLATSALHHHHRRPAPSPHAPLPIRRAPTSARSMTAAEVLHPATREQALQRNRMYAVQATPGATAGHSSASYDGHRPTMSRCGQENTAALFYGRF